MEQGCVSVRLRSGEMINFIPTDEFINKVVGEIKTRQLTSVFENANSTKEISH